jgi:hypothetical protein
MFRIKVSRPALQARDVSGGKAVQEKSQPQRQSFEPLRIVIHLFSKLYRPLHSPEPGAQSAVDHSRRVIHPISPSALFLFFAR